jgi:hypothetical protein
MFNPEPIFITVPRQSVWRDPKTSEAYIYSRDGAPLRVLYCCAIGSCKEEAILHLDVALWKLKNTAACIYKIGNSIVEESSFGFTAKARWAVEDTLTFDLIY